MSDWIFESVNEKVDGGYIEFFKKKKYGKVFKVGGGGKIFVIYWGRLGFSISPLIKKQLFKN